MPAKQKFEKRLSNWKTKVKQERAASSTGRASAAVTKHLLDKRERHRCKEAGEEMAAVCADWLRSHEDNKKLRNRAPPTPKRDGNLSVGKPENIKPCKLPLVRTKLLSGAVS